MNRPDRFIATAAALALALYGCERAEPAAPVEPAHPQFWLRNGHLADTVAGTTTRFVEGPVRVELLANGFVRSVAGQKEQIEGYLSPADLHAASAGQGLMLYAKYPVDLRLDSPDGKVVGRLHPGAFVSVRPFDDKHWTVQVPAYRFRAVVERDALGIEPVAEAPPLISGNVFPVLWRERLKAESGIVATSLLCGQAWRDGETVTQYHSGVEIRGVLEKPMYESEGEIGCGPQRVFNEDGRYLIDGGGVDAKVADRIPEDFVAFGLPSDDPLERLIRSQASVFWLSRSETGLACDEWKFGKSRWVDGAAPHGDTKILVSRIQKRGWSARQFLVVAYQRPASGSPGNFVSWHSINGYGETHPLLGADDDALYFGRRQAFHGNVSEIASSPAFDLDYRSESFPSG